MAEVFVIRLYRRRVGALGQAIGVVDAIGLGTRQSFHSLTELIAILRESHQTHSRPRLVLVQGQNRGVRQRKEERQ